MEKLKIITTSWDDGHPKDQRIAELLDKYNLKGTFYIPKANDENEVMAEKEIISLSKEFEIGGHTINHVRIRTLLQQTLSSEILGCHQWLKELINKDPVSFCFPGGVLNQNAINYTKNIGFKVIRTTELLSTEVKGVVIPTTLQVFKHSSSTYYKHLLKRKKWSSLANYSRFGSSSNLLFLTERYLNHTLKSGGCFHLWGHSWEIDQFNLWGEVEQIFKIISNLSEATYLDNGSINNKSC